MSDSNKHNLLYFQSRSMRGLFDEMEEWQQVNKRRLLSTSIERDGDTYCCIALTNPSEVVITDVDGHQLSLVTSSSLPDFYFAPVVTSSFEENQP
jgi:hypothetical protein